MLKEAVDGGPDQKEQEHLGRRAEQYKRRGAEEAQRERRAVAVRGAQQRLDVRVPLAELLPRLVAKMHVALGDSRTDHPLRILLAVLELTQRYYLAVIGY